MSRGTSMFPLPSTSGRTHFDASALAILSTTHILLLRPTSDACFKDFYPLFEEAKYGLDDPAYNHKNNLEETNNDKASKNDYNETN